MKVKDLNKWNEIRKKGMPRYLLINGILYWGIPIGIIISILSLINSVSTLSSNPLMAVLGFVVAGIIYGIPIGGIFGVMMWKANERHWNESKGNNRK